MPTINFNKQEITIGFPIVKKEVLFCREVVNGLTSNPKYLQSKYLYDTEGDRLFREIMNCREYYPFNSELEIFSERTEELANAIIAPGGAFRPDRTGCR